MTALIEPSKQVLHQRRELLEELRRVDLTLETAALLDRTADRLANVRLAEVLHERAEERRRAARGIRAALTARVC